MVGFPSETEEEFQDTCKLVQEFRFDHIEIYMYQPRPGTKAAKMPNQISTQVARRRYCRLVYKSIFSQIQRRSKCYISAN